MARSLSSAMILLLLWFAICASGSGAPPATDVAPPAGAAQSASEVKSQAEAPPPEHRAKKSKKEKDPETKEAREQRVTAFVEQHNPELAKLLAHLKKTKPEQYDQAVRDLARTVTSLINTKARDARLYELELKGWQAKTRVELLVAQSMVAEKAGLEAKLREAVQEELKVKSDELAYRRDKTATWYNRQIERLEKDREELVETRVKKLLGGSRKDAPRKAKRPAKAE